MPKVSPGVVARRPLTSLSSTRLTVNETFLQDRRTRHPPRPLEAPLYVPDLEGGQRDDK